jgi:hypothetical protein
MPTGTITTSEKLGTVMKLRKPKRYRLEAPAHFSWEGMNGMLLEAEGATRDISLRGIFILADLAPQPEAYVEVDVYLPSVTGSPKAVHLHGEGKVLRVEKRTGVVQGFAADVVFQTDTSDGETILNPRKVQ